MSTYYLRSDNSDLSGGTDFNNKLLSSGGSQGPIDIDFDLLEQRTSYGFTEPNVPYNNDWETGGFTVKVNISSGDINIACKISVSRINSSGAQQQVTTETAEQTMTAGVKTFDVTSKDWSAGNYTDRIRVNYMFRNTSVKTTAAITVYRDNNMTVVTSITGGSFWSHKFIDIGSTDLKKALGVVQASIKAVLGVE